MILLGYMLKKTDILAILILGELVALFALPVLKDTGLDAVILGRVGLSPVLVLPVFTPLAALFCLFGIAFLAKKSPLFLQIGKFAAVGVANTAVDFGIFSILKLFTGVTFGIRIAGINVPGFSMAVLNSYVWNKFWTFGRKESKQIPGEFLQFLVVSIVGVVINSGLIWFITTVLRPQFGVDPGLWATLAKVIATPISMVWNFLGYKFIVFKK